MGVIVSGISFTGQISTVSNSMIERSPATGYLWTIVQTAASSFKFYRSTNNGTSWTDQGTATAVGLYQQGEIRVDSTGADLHWVYCTFSSGRDRIIYKRIPINSGSAATGTTGTLELYSTAATGPGNTTRYIAVQPWKASSGDVHLVIAQSFVTASGGSGVNLHGVTVKNNTGRDAIINGGIVTGTRAWSTPGDTNLSPSIDIEHTGDGITSSTPNMWVTWNAKTVLYGVKLTWSGTKWAGPSSPTTIKSGVGFYSDAPCRWDGARLLVAVVNVSNNARATVYERNKSNTSTTTRTTTTDCPGGAMNSVTVGYNHVTQDIRVFADVLGSAVYWNDYIRATGLWTGWTAVVAGVYSGDGYSGYGVRRSTAGNYQYDYVQLDGGAVGPYPYRHVSVPVNFAPNAPTWNFSSGKYGLTATPATYDVGGPLYLDWIHNDPRNEAQGSYALSRQIGAATVQYWRASDSTWQAAEVQNSSSTTALSLTPAQWVGAGGAADATHLYKVKTWDSGGLPSPYGTGVSVIPSAHSDPTLTAPTHQQVLSTATVTAEWTVAEQSAYRVTLHQPIGVDDFGRTAASGWGTADYGGAWSILGAAAAADFSVSGGTGRHSHPAVNVSHFIGLAGVLAADLDLTFTVTAAAAATGATIEVAARVRWIDSSNYVGVRLLMAVGGGLQLVVHQVKAGVDTNSGAAPVFAQTGPGPHQVRFQAIGSTIRARTWNPALPEPDGWESTLTTSHLDAGKAYLLSYLNSGNTNTLPFLIQFDGLRILPTTAAHDSGWQADPTPTAPSVLTYTPDVELPDTAVFLLGLQTRNAEALPSLARSALFSVDYIEPALPDIATITPDPDHGGIYVTVSQPAPTGGQPVTARLDLLHRRVGDTSSGTRIAAAIQTGVAILDWRTLSGLAYEYAALAVGENGTIIQSGWEA